MVRSCFFTPKAFDNRSPQSRQLYNPFGVVVVIEFLTPGALRDPGLCSPTPSGYVPGLFTNTKVSTRGFNCEKRVRFLHNRFYATGSYAEGV